MSGREIDTAVAAYDPRARPAEEVSRQASLGWRATTLGP